MSIQSATGSIGAGSHRDPWAAVYTRLANHPHRTVLIAEMGGEPVGAASLQVAGKAGWLRGASVIPSARGRGIQRAMIAERVRIAVERGCDVVGASAEPDGSSAENLRRMGMAAIGTRRHYPYVPNSMAVKGPAQTAATS
jgi:GNAT superfamily N-acetyltransferase